MILFSVLISPLSILLPDAFSPPKPNKHLATSASNSPAIFRTSSLAYTRYQPMLQRIMWHHPQPPLTSSLDLLRSIITSRALNPLPATPLCGIIPQSRTSHRLSANEAATLTHVAESGTRWLKSAGWKP